MLCCSSTESFIFGAFSYPKFVASERQYQLFQNFLTYFTRLQEKFIVNKNHGISVAIFAKVCVWKLVDN